MFRLVIFFFSIANISNSAKILTACVFPSYSHNLVYNEVWKELALRGHQVTSITPNPIGNSSIAGLKEIDISFAHKIWSEERKVTKITIKEFLIENFALLGKITEKVFPLPEVQQLIKKSKFDLVIVEWLHPAIFAFSAVFKCPIIGITSFPGIDSLSNGAGRPVHPIMYPPMYLPFKTPRTFWERITSLDVTIFEYYIMKYDVYPNSNKLIETYFGSNLPRIEDIIKNVSLLFENTNSLLSLDRPYSSRVIHFSGVHVKSPKALPEDIQSFLDNSTQGAIYFSLGSYLKSNMLAEHLKKIILETFEELPYSVLWKCDDDMITTTSHRVKISKWFPQQDVLAHKNIKVFITQGGMQSIEEAIRRRVPMVGIPFIVDQAKNVQALKNLGAAQFIDKTTTTKDEFKKIIIDVAENFTYRKKINELADILEDEPMHGLDKVIWWIEYVLRHKGAQHLRNPQMDIPWYQYLFLDVLAFLATCLATILYAILWLLRLALRLVGKKQKNE